eukprot:676489_1
MNTARNCIISSLLLLSSHVSTASSYILVRQVLNSNNAQIHCQQTYGTSLASIHDETDNQQAADLCELKPGCIDSCVNIDKSCHIGLNDKQNERGTSRLGWVWNDGTSYDYQNWRTGSTQTEPFGGDGSDCVVIFPSVHPNSGYRGNWADIECTTKDMYFLCNTPPTSNPTKTPTNNPTKKPTKNPTNNPTNKPTLNPTKVPTHNPSQSPSKYPSKYPSQSPSKYPSLAPSSIPTLPPSTMPTNAPTMEGKEREIMETSTESHSNTETILERTSDKGFIYRIMAIIGIVLFVVICVLVVLVVSCYYRGKKSQREVETLVQVSSVSKTDVGENANNMNGTRISTQNQTTHRETNRMSENTETTQRTNDPIDDDDEDDDDDEEDLNGEGPVYVNDPIDDDDEDDDEDLNGEGPVYVNDPIDDDDGEDLYGEGPTQAVTKGHDTIGEGPAHAVTKGHDTIVRTITRGGATKY